MIISRILILVVMFFLTSMAISAGPGSGRESGNETGSFGKENSNPFNQSFSIQSNGPVLPDDLIDDPDNVPIDAGVGFILIGGLLAGAIKIVQRVKGKS